MNGILVLIRHGESLWNAKSLWTGWKDIELSDKGKKEALVAAERLKDITFEYAFTSTLSRAKETLNIVLSHANIPVYESPALNERNYGIYTGKNKIEIMKQIGDEEFFKLRRGWDYPIPEGESLKQLYARVVPYYQQYIAPLVQNGKHVLIVAHGNSLRALIKYLEHISEEDISYIELITGEIVMYTINNSGAVVSKDKRAV